jgi:PH domain associated with Beige/BEACH
MHMFTLYYRSLSQVSSIYTRRYRLVDSAIEVFLSKGKCRSLFVDFGVTKADIDRRNEFMRLLVKVRLITTILNITSSIIVSTVPAALQQHTYAVEYALTALQYSMLHALVILLALCS